MFGLLVPAIFAGALAAAQYPPKDVTYLAPKPEAFAIATPHGVDEQRFVKIGGLEQWVVIRGHDRKNPVLLVLGSPGGGPGATTSHVLNAFLPWEKHFTVVHWDVRGSGKTYAKAGRTLTPDHSLNRIVADGEELTEYLRERLGQRKIGLLAGGYGTVQGLKLIAAHPERYSVFASFGLAVNPAVEREQYFHRRLIEIATANSDADALKDLAFSGWKVWGDGDDPAKRQALIKVYRKYRAPNPVYIGAQAPGWTPTDFGAHRAGMLKGDEMLLPEFRTYDFASLGVEFAVPIVVLQGEEDRFSPTPYARAWFDKVKAPKKAFAVIPGGGNHFMETHQAEFLALLLQHVRPLAVAP